MGIAFNQLIQRTFSLNDRLREVEEDGKRREGFASSVSGFFSQAGPYREVAAQDLKTARIGLRQAADKLQKFGPTPDRVQDLLAGVEAALDNVRYYRKRDAELRAIGAGKACEFIGICTLFLSIYIFTRRTGLTLVTGGLTLGWLYAVTCWLGRPPTPSVENQPPLTLTTMINQALVELREWRVDRRRTFQAGQFAFEADLVANLPDYAERYREVAYEQLAREAKEETAGFRPSMDRDQRLTLLMEKVYPPYRRFYDGGQPTVRNCLEKTGCNCNGERDLLLLKAEFAGIEPDPERPFAFQAYHVHNPASVYYPKQGKVWDLRDGEVIDQVAAVWDLHYIPHSFLQRQGIPSPILDERELILAPARKSPQEAPSQKEMPPLVASPAFDLPPSNLVYNDSDVIPKYSMPTNPYEKPPQAAIDQPKVGPPPGDKNSLVNSHAWSKQDYIASLTVEDVVWGPSPVLSDFPFYLGFRDRNRQAPFMVFEDPTAMFFFNDQIAAREREGQRLEFAQDFLLKLGRDSLAHYLDPHLVKRTIALLEDPTLADKQTSEDLKKLGLHLGKFHSELGNCIEVLQAASFKTKARKLEGLEGNDYRVRWRQLVREAIVEANPMLKDLVQASQTFHRKIVKDPAGFISLLGEIHFEARMHFFEIAEAPGLSEQDPNEDEADDALFALLNDPARVVVSLPATPDKTVVYYYDDDRLDLEVMDRKDRDRWVPSQRGVESVELDPETVVQLYLRFVVGAWFHYGGRGWQQRQQKARPWRPEYTRIFLNSESLLDNYHYYFIENFRHILAAYPRKSWTADNPAADPLGSRRLLGPGWKASKKRTIIEERKIPPDLAEVVQRMIDRAVSSRQQKD